ncbi:MAG: glycoside hydrolase family 127 protein [Acidimicrobiales bacterium]
MSAGPVEPTQGALRALRPLGLDDVQITGGIWAERQKVNRDITIPAGAEELRAAGAIENFNVAKAGGVGAYHGPVYEDGEVYKWLEALAWEQARQPSGRLASWQKDVSEIVAGAQAPDGYLNTFVQVTAGDGGRFADLAVNHEIFNVAALTQAAVAQVRSAHDDGLAGVAVRAVDQLAATFGPGRRQGVCGHPLIEMALTELFRLTGQQKYLQQAKYFVGQRGHGLLAGAAAPLSYFSDRVPVRGAVTVEGHAVRAIYLAAGATDVAVEAHDEELLDALCQQWEAMVSTKMYLTGGLGSRWEGESFGDPYELPNDRAYCETCAAVASVQWAWRLLLLTGHARYAELIERTLFNAVLPGWSLSGDRFFYVNVLQLRADAVDNSDDGRSPAGGRRAWFGTSCCPTNLMRTISSLAHYYFTRSDRGLQVHQYASSTVRALVAGAEVVAGVTTGYPWEGEVELMVLETGEVPWELSLRVPVWADGARLLVNGVEAPFPVEPGSYCRTERRWRRGDTVRLSLPMAPRLTAGVQRVDAVRGCRAIERGPLVYCIEQVDQPAGVLVDDVVLERGAITCQARPGLLGGVTTIEVPGAGAGREPGPALYHRDGPSGTGLHPTLDAGNRARLLAVPYFAWANRGPGAMRVWLPLA